MDSVHKGAGLASEARRVGCRIGSEESIHVVKELKEISTGAKLAMRQYLFDRESRSTSYLIIPVLWSLGFREQDRRSEGE